MKSIELSRGRTCAVVVPEAGGRLHQLAIYDGRRWIPLLHSPVVYTPKRAVCVEPQTCAPVGFNLAAQGVHGTGMAVVDRRHPLAATTTWRWTIGAQSR